MRKLGQFIIGTILLAGLCACGGKRPGARKPVRVKVMRVGAVQVIGSHGYSGTMEEEGGASLSFPMAGTVRQVMVDEGQTVGRGQLLATLDATDQNATLASSRAATGPPPSRPGRPWRRHGTNTTAPGASTRAA